MSGYRDFKGYSLFPRNTTAVQTGVNVTKPIGIEHTENVAIQIFYSAAVSGTLDIQFSDEGQPVTLPYASADDTYFTNPSDVNWTTDTSLSESIDTTTSGSILIQMSRVSSSWARAKLTSTNSSTSTVLTGSASGKE